jgi:hypothetical protein
MNTLYGGRSDARMKGEMWVCARLGFFPAYSSRQIARFIKKFQPDKAAMMMEVKSRRVANRKSLSAFYSIQPLVLSFSGM